jgi:hypothetical protein
MNPNRKKNLVISEIFISWGVIIDMLQVSLDANHQKIEFYPSTTKINK